MRVVRLVRNKKSIIRLRISFTLDISVFQTEPEMSLLRKKEFAVEKEGGEIREQAILSHYRHFHRYKILHSKSSTSSYWSIQNK